MKCQRVVEETWKILQLLGVDTRYLKLKWISASEGAVFAEEVAQFTALLKEMGPNPLAQSVSEATAHLDSEAEPTPDRATSAIKGSG